MGEGAAGLEDAGSRGVPISGLRRASAVLGDPWTMLVLKEAFNGTRRFTDYQRNLGIPRQTLALRLEGLCASGMLWRRYLGPSGRSTGYAPTAKTLDLHQVMFAIWLLHRAAGEAPGVLPFDLIHRSCGSVLAARLCCRACGDEVAADGLRIAPAPVGGEADSPPARLARRNDDAFTAASGRAGGLLAASIVGDVACSEILYALLQGPATAAELSRRLQIGAAVVRDRLGKLGALRLVAAGPDDARYRALPRASLLLPVLLAICDWGDRWCNGARPPPEVRLHRCGALLDPRFRCTHCDGWVDRTSVTVRPLAMAA